MNKLAIFQIKLDRLSAWVLAVGMALYFISGYGMTKGIISQNLALKLHLDYLALITLTAFTIHTSYAIHLALKRWRIWNSFSKSCLAIFYILFLGFFVYVDRVYIQKPVAISTTSANQTTTTATNTNISDPVTSTDTTNTPSTGANTTKTFSAQELAKYNGLNGQPAYVAVDGTVYDMSSIFRNGQHHGFSAGQDLTNAFHQFHTSGQLDGLPIVGIFK
ncbi:MAG: hypothetical protein NTW50_00820 [Candidatus Berkelbacteria bacterium]|nr:hypothetical protein [Candidatus Berkelbacteria bacterium]